MTYGIFLIETDADGAEHVGRMVHHCDLWSHATRFVRDCYAAGALPDGTEVPVNGLKILDLEKRPWGDNPPRIEAGQVL